MNPVRARAWFAHLVVLTSVALQLHERISVYIVHVALRDLLMDKLYKVRLALLASCVKPFATGSLPWPAVCCVIAARMCRVFSIATSACWRPLQRPAVPATAHSPLFLPRQPTPGPQTRIRDGPLQREIESVTVRAVAAECFS
jgi:hypothetical protein